MIQLNNCAILDKLDDQTGTIWAFFGESYFAETVFNLLKGLLK